MRFSSFCVFFLVSISVFGQSNQKFANPEAASYAPIQLSASQAAQESEQVKNTCGFSSAYIGKSDMEYLMNLSKCVGIRVYNGKADSRQQFCGVLAVAIDENGKEIGHFMANKYFDVGSVDAGSGYNLDKINQSSAKNMVNNVAQSSSLDYQKVYFSKTTVTNRLEVQGATGLHIRPGEVGGYKTMMISAAKLDKGTISDLDDTYMKSSRPCPVQCGDTGNYLVEPK